MSPVTLARAPTRPSLPAGRPTGSQRLLAAFKEVETFPALRSSRDAMSHAIANTQRRSSELIGVIESDPGLVMAVLRAAGRTSPQRRPPAVPEAVVELSTAELEAVAQAIPVFDFFEQSGPWSDIAEGFRVHARATQSAAAYLRRVLGCGPRPELRSAALLHDIGKLVLLRAHDRYEPITNARGSADERLEVERAELGIDHALVGGVIARRLGFAASLSRVIELHHQTDVPGDVATIRLADMLAHYATGGVVQGAALSRAARTAGLSPDDLRDALDELPGGARAEKRGSTPSPLTPRETEMVQQLATGKVYKQIAAHFGVHVSTVRTHLANTYRKLGVVDRCQTVLLARDRGWL
jgi:putative nucleotidyltransferase with HDIG domain